ncbi:hypothetical protein RD792_016963 [Penstemon davidsonii]|uniref:nicotinate phosphoribosyltransferase n=1 Tax=Penstemon davidsonii TaxID=160366 RepID=A0ABR0CL67_9LAMI|nr:hypothetical protein RD792_016963 [Penstemon davidsonii]
MDFLVRLSVGGVKKGRSFTSFHGGVKKGRSLYELPWRPVYYVIFWIESFVRCHVKCRRSGRDENGGGTLPPSSFWYNIRAEREREGRRKVAAAWWCCGLGFGKGLGLALADSIFAPVQWSHISGGIFGETNQSELAAFISYALAFLENFLALVDTYDVMRSGIPNFCAVALALNDLGYKAVGIRLDSGDLAYLSSESRKFFRAIEMEFKVRDFGKTGITASNDLNEETLDALNKHGHEVDAFGIGTHLVTCYAQPALGVVFKLVEINNQPRIKLSEDVSKVGERILCRHPFNESKRAYVVPQRVEELMKCFWPGKSGKNREELPPIKLMRERCIEQLGQMRPDHMRRLNPTPYKVSVSAKLPGFFNPGRQAPLLIVRRHNLEGVVMVGDGGWGWRVGRGVVWDGEDGEDFF